ncbi:hypothetical protein Ccrd_000399 [Cynara cardunculus var. scolymus]|uniref:Uncharacterized protein n=1 Tax=Cynara cardunculus var. scolymus TaxID=59895 RepID=A0A124SDN5_CYNCS|nr:hypothetical protein Ccrd_000399 [Cynara cardunculus var. scolymus]
MKKTHQTLVPSPLLETSDPCTQQDPHSKPVGPTTRVSCNVQRCNKDGISASASHQMRTRSHPKSQSSEWVYLFQSLQNGCKDRNQTQMDGLWWCPPPFPAAHYPTPSHLGLETDELCAVSGPQQR